MDLAVGQTFGRFIIDGVLGEGAMGRVYRASDTALQRRVALKVLIAKDVRSEAAVRDLMREARAAAAINHENAVTIFDVGEVEGVPFIAMEYISGVSLRELIGDETVTLGQRVVWLVAVARALSAAHDRGLVHRDVKPDNILVRKDGLVKVLDFGIAQRHSIRTQVHATTMPFVETKGDLSIAGTPAYMAPEQLRGEKLDGRCDQFAWGVVAYELLSGSLPFQSAQLMALMSEILSVTPPELSTKNAGVSKGLSSIVARAMSKLPADRFSTMRELLEQLVLELPSVPGSAPGLLPSVLPSAPSGVGRVHDSLQTTRTHKAFPDRAAVSRWSVGLLALAGIAVVVGAMRSCVPRTTVSEVVSNTTAARAVPVTALEVPSSLRLDAVAAFREGLQAARDGAGGTARERFARAAQLDPTMVSANVMLAALSVFQNRTVARGALERARQQRSALPGRYKLLLASLEPLLDRDPIDIAAAEKILEEGIQAYPMDAHLRLQLAIYRSARGEKDALLDAERAIALDPEFVAARLVRAIAYESQGQEEKALETYDACVASSPTATSCIAGKLKLRSRKGECELVRSEAKRWTTALPSDSEGYFQRAVYASADGEASELVWNFLRRSRELLPENARARRAAVDELWRALFEGKFDAAFERATELGALVAQGGGIGENGEAALSMIDAAEERGRHRDAVKVAKDFLAKRELWAEAARIEQDPTPVFLGVNHRAGLLSDHDVEAQRTAWINKWATRGRAGERWLVAYAMPASTKPEAEEALRQLPQYLPLPTLPELRFGFALGRTYFLADRIDDAIPVLKQAAEDCGSLKAAVAHVRAVTLLGDAYARKGQRALACEAYALATSRWHSGATYSHARRAWGELGCDRNPRAGR